LGGTYEMSTVVVETRCSITELAKAFSIIKRETNYSPKTRAEIVRLCVQSICSLYTDDITEEEALHLLRDALGPVNLGRTREGRVQVSKSLRTNLQTAAMQEEKEDVPLVDQIKRILEKGI